MVFAVIGLTFENAAIEVREQVSFSDGEKMKLYEKLEHLGIAQAVIISTCNRSELYVYYDDETLLYELKKIYFDYLKEEIDIMTLIEKDAYEHLFKVCAGLASMVVGEDQILGQMREGYAFANQLGYCGKEMHKTMQEAIACAKEIKTIYKINEHPLSIAYIAIQKLRQVCGIQGMNILCVGSGDMSITMLKYLYELQPKKIFLCNRSHQKAQALLLDYPGIQLIEFEERYAFIDDMDILVTATASPHKIFKREFLKERKKSLYIMDIASPRDVDSDVIQLANIELYDLDSLKDIAETNHKIRNDMIPHALVMMNQRIDELMERLAQIDIDVTFQTLQTKALAITEDTYQILLRKLDLNTHEKSVLKRTLTHALQRMIKEPMQVLKTVDKENKNEYIKVIQTLYQIEGDE